MVARVYALLMIQLWLDGLYSSWVITLTLITDLYDLKNGLEMSHGKRNVRSDGRVRRDKQTFIRSDPPEYLLVSLDVFMWSLDDSFLKGMTLWIVEAKGLPWLEVFEYMIFRTLKILRSSHSSTR